MRSRKTLILLDLDGVILNSKPNMEYAWKEVKRRHGVQVPFDAYFALIGRPFQDIMGMLGLGADATAIETTFRIASMEGMALATFYPKVEDALTELERRGATLGVVTSKDELRTSAILARLPVTFKTVQTPRGRMRGKPAPDYLLMAMAEACTDPAETVYIGDMDADFEAAHRARIDYAHAAWGYGAPPRGDCVTLEAFHDILRFVAVKQ